MKLLVLELVGDYSDSSGLLELDVHYSHSFEFRVY